MDDDDIVLAAQAGKPVADALEKRILDARFGGDDPVLDGEHFHGCPTATGRPFDCDYCQERARSMAGEP